jgi:hypothetical protein
VGSSYACAARRLALLIFVTFAFELVPANSAFAAAQTVQPSGPLTEIALGDDLTCQVAYQGQRQFYSPNYAPASCGTFVSVDVPGAGPQSYGLSGVAGNAFTPVSQSAVAGSGTSQDPYRVTTVADAGSTGVRVTQVDSYVVGQEYYRSDITATNTGSSGTQTGRLYHAADCYLQGSDSGYGYVDQAAKAVACSQNQNNDPPALIEEFAPLSSGALYVESGFSTVWADVRSQSDLPNTCDCTTDQDNGMGIEWHFSLDAGQSQTFSMLSSFSPQGVVAPNHVITAAGDHAFSGNTPLTVSGALATFTDSVPGTAASDYTATVDWGDGSASSPGTITANGNGFTVTGSHAYGTPGAYTITVTIAVNGNSSQATATDSVTASAPTPAPASKPAVQTGAASGTGSTATVLTGVVNAGGLPTTFHWEYGLDPAYRGGGFSGNIYDQSTPPQAAGSAASPQPVSASVGGLLPNTLYHARLVASNSAGTTTGQDQTFKTGVAPVPPLPTVGRNGNFTPAGGNVFVKLNGKFVKLTEVRQLPSGTVVDALHGSLNLVSASGKKGKTYNGTFTGAVFKVTQAGSGPNKGLSTLAIVEGAYKGAPSYAACKARKARKARLAPRLSSGALQTLRSRANGRYRTRGRYAAGSVRGTRWTTVDRCDGTLISVQQHSVLVTDLVRRINRLVKAGHHYLALAPKRK